MLSRFHSEIVFIVRPVLSIRPYSVTDNLRGRYHTVSGYDITIELVHHLPNTITNFYYIDEKNISSIQTPKKIVMIFVSYYSIN